MDLKQIIEKRFDEARSAGDVASMERFLKLFPLINEHNSGLKRFGAQLCSQIEALGEQNFRIMQVMYFILILGVYDLNLFVVQTKYPCMIVAYVGFWFMSINELF